MKLLNIKLINNGFSVQNDFVLPYNVVFCVLDGQMSFEEQTVKKEQGIAVAKNDRVTVVADASASVVCLAFDGAAEDMTFSCPAVFDIANFNSFKSFAAAIKSLREWYPDDDSAAEALGEYLGSILVKAENGNACGNKHVNMAKRYIDENYFNDIKIEQLAEFLGVDRKYLRNLFMEHLGMSTKDYLMERRIERAKELLEIGGVPVNSVAFSVGYRDALGFSKIFKKYVGVSPSEYRENSAQIRVKKEDPKPMAVESPKEDIKYFLL